MARETPKMQAALEYLHTYIWMVIIIAIVLIVLSYYAVTGISARVTLPPNSCEVNRPYGPNTTQFLSLTGTCNGDLPEYVASFGGQFLGGGSGTWYTDITNCAQSDSCIGFYSPLPYPQAGCNLTINAWSYDSGMGSLGSPGSITYNSWFTTRGYPKAAALGGVLFLWNNSVSSDGNPDQVEFGVEYNDTIIRYEAAVYPSPNEYFIKGNFKDKWIMTTITVNNGVATVYLNGTAVSSASPAIQCSYLPTHYPSYGVIGMWDRVFNGSISNVQVYDAALDANTIHALYAGGMGQPPLDLSHLIGWWELNGNANDSSGNGDNGQAQQITHDFTNLYSEP